MYLQISLWTARPPNLVLFQKQVGPQDVGSSLDSFPSWNFRAGRSARNLNLTDWLENQKVDSFKKRLPWQIF